MLLFRQCRSLWKSACPSGGQASTRPQRGETANPCTNASKDAEAPFNALPRQNKLRLLSNKQHKRLSRKPRRTSLVFVQSLPSSRSRHFRKPPTLVTCQRPKHLPDKKLSMAFSPSLLMQRRKHRVQRRSRHLRLGLRRRRFGPLYTRRRPSRHPQARLRRRCAGNAPFGQTSHQSKTLFGCADGSHGSDRKHSRMTPMTVVSANTATLDPKADRAAARAGLRQGQRVEELERMFDDAGADVIALQEHLLQTTGQRCGGLFQCVYSAHKALSEMHFGSDEAVSSSSNYPRMQLTLVFCRCACPQSAFWPSGRRSRDGSFCSEAFGGVGAETESKNVVENCWMGSVCAQSTHLLAMAVKRGMGMALSKLFETTSFAVTNLCSLLLCRVASMMEWNSVKTHASIRALAVSFHSSTFHVQTTKKTRICSSQSQSRFLWQEAFQQCLPCSFPKHIQIDEAYAEMVAKVTEAATQRETMRAPCLQTIQVVDCRPCMERTGAKAALITQISFRQVAVVTRSLCDVPLCNPPWCGGSFKRT